MGRLTLLALESVSPPELHVDLGRGLCLLYDSSLYPNQLLSRGNNGKGWGVGMGSEELDLSPL